MAVSGQVLAFRPHGSAHAPRPRPGVPDAAPARVRSPFGELFVIDTSRGTVDVNFAGGSWTLAGPGSGVGEVRQPSSMAFVAGECRSESRLFVCDGGNDRVQVFDGSGRFVQAFGGRGRRPGQMTAPSALAIVHPRLPGDHEPIATWQEPLLAVTDAGGRLQIFGLDGALFASIAAVPPGVQSLEWRVPFLVAHYPDGRIVRVHLAASIAGHERAAAERAVVGGGCA